jgi:hypothetical protein
MTIYRPLLPIIGLLASSLALAAEPAKPTDPAPKANDNACAWFASIDDWRELDNRHLIVWASRNEFYELELSTPLFDLGSAESIAFVDHNSDGRVCGFGMDKVVVPHSSISGSSTIIGMTKLDEAGLAQLADQYKIKLRQPKKKAPPEAAKPTPIEAAAK